MAARHTPSQNTTNFVKTDKTVFENAKEGLDHEDGPSCCYVNASYVVD